MNLFSLVSQHPVASAVFALAFTVAALAVVRHGLAAVFHASAAARAKRIRAARVVEASENLSYFFTRH